MRLNLLHHRSLPLSRHFQPNRPLSCRNLLQPHHQLLPAFPQDRLPLVLPLPSHRHPPLIELELHRPHLLLQVVHLLLRHLVLHHRRRPHLHHLVVLLHLHLLPHMQVFLLRRRRRQLQELVEEPFLLELKDLRRRI